MKRISVIKFNKADNRFIHNQSRLAEKRIGTVSGGLTLDELNALTRRNSSADNADYYHTHTSNLSIIETVVPAGNTVVVDSIPNTTRSIKWVFQIKDALGSNFHYEELAVSYDGVSFIDTVFAKLGSAFNFTIGFEDSLGNINFKITNNEASNITVKVLRMPPL